MLLCVAFCVVVSCLFRLSLNTNLMDPHSLELRRAIRYSLNRRLCVPLQPLCEAKVRIGNSLKTSEHLPHIPPAAVVSSESSYRKLFEDL